VPSLLIPIGMRETPAAIAVNVPSKM